MRYLGLGLATAFFAVAVPASADDKNAPVVLAPTTHWNVDFGEEKCRLARVFGSEEDRHLLFFEQGGPASGFGFVVAGGAFDRFRRPDRISVQFGEFEPVTDRTPMLGDTEGVGTSIIYSGMVFEEPVEGRASDEQATGPETLPRLSVETANAINSITLHYYKRSVVFATGNLGDAIKVLNECSLNFVESWGLDRTAHETMTRRPKWANAQQLARRLQQTYPSEALRKGESGIFRLRVTVEVDGSVSECALNQATISESINSPACREMKRAQFEPALDKDGQPMRSFYTTRIVYRIN